MLTYLATFCLGDSAEDYMGRAAQKLQEDSLADREVEEAVIGNGSVFACFIPFLQALATSDKPPLVRPCVDDC